MRIEKPYLRILRSISDQLEDHDEAWTDCNRCPLHEHRSRVVLYRGFLPAPILFLGEAPGRTEDLTGFPFTGAAGHLLEDAVHELRESFRVVGPRSRGIARGSRSYNQLTYAIANVVGCIPFENGRGSDMRTPTPEEAYACSPRLREFYEIAKPRLIFAMGISAKKWLGYSLVRPSSIHVVHVAHPAAILREPDLRSAKSYRRFVVQIKAAIEQYLPEVVSNG